MFFLLELPVDVWTHVLFALSSVHDVQSASATCKALAEHIRRLRLLERVLRKHGIRIGFRAVRHCEDQSVNRFAEDNIVNALRRTILRGTLVCRPLNGVCTVTVQLDGKMDQDCTFSCDVLHEKAFALKSKTCFFASCREFMIDPYELQMYGHYLRLRVRAGRHFIRTNYLLAVEEDDGDQLVMVDPLDPDAYTRVGGPPSISALQRLPLQLRSCTLNIRAFTAPPET